MKERLYYVTRQTKTTIIVFDNLEPMTHKESMTFISKMMKPELHSIIEVNHYEKTTR